MQRRRWPILPRGRAGGRRAAAGLGCRHAIGRAGGGPSDRDGHQARLMGHPWCGLTERERFQHAQIDVALLAAATRRPPGHGRADGSITMPYQINLEGKGGELDRRGVEAEEEIRLELYRALIAAVDHLE